MPSSHPSWPIFRAAVAGSCHSRARGHRRYWTARCWDEDVWGMRSQVETLSSKLQWPWICKWSLIIEIHRISAWFLQQFLRLELDLDVTPSLDRLLNIRRRKSPAQFLLGFSASSLSRFWSGLSVDPKYEALVCLRSVGMGERCWVWILYRVKIRLFHTSNKISADGYH